MRSGLRPGATPAAIGSTLTGDSRTSLAARGSLASAAERIVLAATSIISIPILLSYLGMEVYGFWVTTVTLMNWVALLHMGLPESLLNRIASTPRSHWAARGVLSSTAFWMMLVLAGGSVAVLLVLLTTDAWSLLLNADAQRNADDARVFLAVMWATLALSMPMRVPMAVLRGDQRVDLVALANSLGVIGRLAAILFVVWLDAGIVWLVVLSTVPPILALIGVTLVVFGRRVPWPALRYFDSAVGRGLLATGIGFTGVTIAALAMTSTDVILIAQMLGPAVVPTYSVSFALIALFSGIEIAIMRGVWPGYADAAASTDGAWVRTANRRLTVGFTALSVLFGVCLVTAGPALIEAWAGPEALPPSSLLVVFALTAVVQAVEIPHSYLLAATGRVRRLTVIGLAGAAVNIPVSVALGVAFGVTGIAAGTLVALVLVVTFTVRSARRVIVEIEDRGVDRA